MTSLSSCRPHQWTSKGAEAFAHRLQNRLHKQVVIDGEMLTRTVSIGVAAGVPGRDSTSDLLRRPIRPLGRPRASGGSQVATFNPRCPERREIRNDIELELEGTIDSE